MAAYIPAAHVEQPASDPGVPGMTPSLAAHFRFRLCGVHSFCAGFAVNLPGPHSAHQAAAAEPVPIGPNFPLTQAVPMQLVPLPLEPGMYCPLEQNVHSDIAGEAWNVPIPHALQALRPTPSPYVPAAHTLHAASAAVALPRSPNFPNWHPAPIHVLRPATSAYFPLLQRVHATSPATAAYFPMLHKKHSDAPTVLEDPGAHGAHDALAFSVDPPGPNFPAVHASPSHSVAASDLSTLYCPDLHFLHIDTAPST